MPKCICIFISSDLLCETPKIQLFKMAEANLMQTGRTTSRQSNNPFGKAIQGIAATIGLASETIHHHKQKRASQKFQRDSISRSLSNDDCIPTLNEFNVSPSPDEAETQEELLMQVDEVAWALDEVQDDITTSHGQAVPFDHSPLSSPKLADSFLQSHRPAKDPVATGRLELPVVITQRRPKARTRGFIRAYAPILQNVGIDQDTFLDFIDQLNKAVEPSPWISAIDLASLAGHAFPEPIHLLISASALMATQVTAEVVSRSKSNAFLDKMNQEFFKPKGLIALVVTWKPKKDGSEQNATSIYRHRHERRSREQEAGGGWGPRHEETEVDDTDALCRRDVRASRVRTSDIPPARSHTQSRRAAKSRCLPAFRQNTAEYVGPAVRQVKLGGQSAGSSVKRTGHFISDYQDRRAVARWSSQHPDSRMAKLAPAPGFQSRFADPNHPAGSGDFVALVTGGKRTTAEVSREAVRATAAAGREGMMRVRSTTERAGLRVAGSGDGNDGGTPRRIISPRAKEAFGELRPRGDWLPRLPDTATGGMAPRLRRIGSLPLGAPVRTMKKLLQPDILYLMIVNLPTEEEIANAAACLNQVNEETTAE
ncbi:hypothetical protein SLS63_002931 [Diaporthe eres]|uniref:Uncharacterized protein n=1 Tax=Diaporthe eres TaxID=83184 RepID=A0ABR1PHW4_DIAER